MQLKAFCFISQSLLRCSMYLLMDLDNFKSIYLLQGTRTRNLLQVITFSVLSKEDSNNSKKPLVRVISLSDMWGNIKEYPDLCMATHTYYTSLMEPLCFLSIPPTTKAIEMSTQDSIHYPLQLNQFSMEQGPKFPDPLRQKHTKKGDNLLAASSETHSSLIRGKFGWTQRLQICGILDQKGTQQ